MEETPIMKTCGQCGVEKDLTPEFYGVQTASADGFRAICRVCFSDNRSAQKIRDVKNLKNHDRIVRAAKKALASPEGLSAGQLEKYQRIVELDGKKRAKLQAKIQEAHRAEETARRSNNPSLVLVQQHFGSPILLTVDEMRDKLARAKIALGNLTAESDAPARDHVTAYIERVSEMVKEQDERAAFLAQQEQDTFNSRAAEKAVGRLHDEFLPQVRRATTTESKIALREKIRKLKKILLDFAKVTTAVDSTGAEKNFVANAAANALEKMALMLYGGTSTKVVPTDTLANVESRIDQRAAAQEWLEVEEAKRRAYWKNLEENDPKQFERESKSLILQVKGSGPLADMERRRFLRLKRENPQEYERQALAALKPRNFEPENIIWVLVEGKREKWFWPDGRPVRRGGTVEDAEVVYDARLKAWFLPPAPIGAELESVAARLQPMEAYQDEFDVDSDGNPKWKYRPEGSGGEYAQMNNGKWKRTDSPSPWTKPERVTFKKAEPPASAAHSEFRHGRFWTKADVEEANCIAAENPSSVLPPLSPFAIADSIATVPQRPLSPKEIERLNRNPYVWARHEENMKRDKEREAALLKGE